MGKDKNAPLRWLGIIALSIAIVYGGVSGYNALFGAKQATLPGTNTPITTGGSGATQCVLAPSVSTAFTDFYYPGTSITPTLTYRYADATGVVGLRGTTAPTYQVSGAQILANATGYLNTLISGVTLNCGANGINGQMKSVANASLTYYADNGLSALNQSNANETTKAAGLQYNWRLHFQGTDKKSTGNMIFVVELSQSANVSSIALSGSTPVAVPGGYAAQGTNMLIKAFALPSLEGSAFADYFLQLNEASGKVVTGQVYTTVYSLQPFVDDDGTFNTGTAAFSTVKNTVEYSTVQTKNFIIN